MSTTTPGGSEGSGSTVPASGPAQPGASTASAASPRSATSAPTAPAQDAAGDRESTDTNNAVRRSLAERFAASRTGATATAAGPAARGQTTRPASPADPTEESTRTVSPPRADDDEAAARPVAGPRRVRLSLSRVDPWSVMKLAFLMSIAIGIGIVVATAVVWFVLDSMHVFADIEELLISIGSEDLVQLMALVEFDRVISMATIIAVVDVLLLTALCTIGAFVYNLVAALVGGLHVTLTDD